MDFWLTLALTSGTRHLPLPDFDQPQAFSFNSIHNGVRVKPYDATPGTHIRGSIRTLPFVKSTCGATEQKFIVDLQELIFPELVFVEKVGGEQFLSDASSKIFNGFTTRC